MRVRPLRAGGLHHVLGLALLASAACTVDDPTGPGDPSPVDDDAARNPAAASISITPVSQAAIVGATLALQATIRDSNGNDLDEAPSWSTRDPDLIEIAADGRVSVRRAGTARVVASAGAVADTLLLDCLARLEVARDTATVWPGAQLRLEASLIGAPSLDPPPGAIAWSSSDPSIAEVSADGMITGMATGRATVQATYGEQTATIDVTVYRPRFASVSAGAMHSCGLLVEGTAWCWGGNGHGELGTGGTHPSPLPSRAATDLTFRRLAAAGGFTCAVGMDDMGYCWGDDSMMELGNPEAGRYSTTPLPVYGGLAMQMISGSDMAHGCGLTVQGDAWCWGYNRFGMIGHGSVRDEPIPVPAIGGLTFTELNSFFFRTCGVDTDGRVYCWGRGGPAQIGDPEFDPELCDGRECSTQPRAAASAVRFRTVNVGKLHTCAVGEDGRVYCWGEGESGQTGVETSGEVLVPTAVLPDERFMAVSAGLAHTCGLTVDGRALCWGDNEAGQLGDGSRTSRPSPGEVSTELRFIGISAGYMHTCAVTAVGDAYCWGMGGYGQLGDGSGADQLVPVRVALD